MKKLLLLIGFILFIWLIWINYAMYINDMKAPVQENTASPTPSSAWQGPYGTTTDKG